MDEGNRNRKRNEGRRERRSFEAAFAAEAVRLCKVGDRSIAQVAIDLDLDLTEPALRDRVKRADIDVGDLPSEVIGTHAKSPRTDLASPPWNEALRLPAGTPLLAPASSARASIG